MQSRYVLDAVERWAGGDYGIVRETSIANQDNGRLDALLFPTCYRTSAFRKAKSNFGIIGIEVKVTRSDFTRGLRIGQYERYRDDPGINGLYLAVPQGLCKPSELPSGVGLLVVRSKGLRPSQYVASCRRHPTLSDNETPSAVLWRLLLEREYLHRMEKYAASRNRKLENQQLGDMIGRLVMSNLTKLVRQTKDQ